MLRVLPTLSGGALLLVFLNIIGMFGLVADKETTLILYLFDQIGNMATMYLGVLLAVSTTRALGSKTYIPVLFGLLLYFGDTN